MVRRYITHDGLSKVNHSQQKINKKNNFNTMYLPDPDALHQVVVAATRLAASASSAHRTLR